MPVLIADILSFALTCSYLNGIVQKNGYLDFRELIASVGHVQLWDHLAKNPHLASKVRVLTIYDSWHQIRLHRTSYRFPSTISKNIVQDDRQTFVACLPLLTGLQAVTIHPPVRVYTAASSLLSNIFSHWPSSIRSLSLKLLNSQPLDMDTHVRVPLRFSCYPLYPNLLVALGHTQSTRARFNAFIDGARARHSGCRTVLAEFLRVVVLESSSRGTIYHFLYYSNADQTKLYRFFAFPRSLATLPAVPNCPICHNCGSST